MVKNADGTVSNVKLMSVGFGEGANARTYAIPTMWDGEDHTEDEAIKRALRMKLPFPSFKTQQEAEAFIKSAHGRIVGSED